MMEYEMQENEMLAAEEMLTEQELQEDAPAECARGIEVITAEIRFFKRQAAESIVEIGLRLIEAKEQLNHGEWLPWLRDEVDFSDVSAQRYMRLAREYGKSVTVTDLGASKALILLGLPASERDEFIAEKHEVNGEEKSVSEMTRKELEQAIRERDEARRAAEDAQKRNSMQAEALRKANEEAGKAIERAEEAEQTVREFSEENVQLTDEIAAAKERIRELEERPVEVAVEVKDASAEQLEAARAEAKSAAEKEFEQKLAEEREKAKTVALKLNEKLHEANEKLKAAAEDGEKEKLAAEIERLRKEISMSGEAIVKFKMRFEAWQQAYTEMNKAMLAVPEEQRDKCASAIRAVLGAWT